MILAPGLRQESSPFLFVNGLAFVGVHELECLAPLVECDGALVALLENLKHLLIASTAQKLLLRDRTIAIPARRREKNRKSREWDRGEQEWISYQEIDDEISKEDWKDETRQRTSRISTDTSAAHDIDFKREIRTKIIPIMT